MRAKPLEENFTGLLIGDVLAARERLAAEDSQLHRREVIRITFVAVEGLTWLLREHVRIASRTMGLLTPTADLALREQTFSITDKGDIIEHVRYVTLPTVIKLTAKQALRVEPSLEIRFDNNGWENLRTSISTRNRITHPKSATDLAISNDDLSIAESGLTWMLATIDYAMSMINLALRAHVTDFRRIIDALERGDKRTLEEYQAGIKYLNDNPDSSLND